MNGRLPQQSTPGLPIGAHFDEGIRIVEFRMGRIYMIKPSQGGVHKSILSGKKFGGGPVLIEEVPKEQMSFLPHGRTEVIDVVFLEASFVGGRGTQVIQGQPGIEKAVDKAFRLGVGKHAFGLGQNNRRIAQGSLIGKFRQFDIGQGRPKKVTKPGCNSMGIKLAGFGNRFFL